MKAPILSVVALAAVVLVACGPSEAELAAATEKAAADSVAAAAAAEHTYLVDVANSKVMWTGTMLGIKSHHGTINLTEGKVSVQGGKLTAGSFTVDMTSMAPLDTNYAADGAKQGTRSMLIGHLQSPDFFDVADHPTATFEITGSDMTSAGGKLTVRGTSDEEKVTDIVITEENGMLKATGKIGFDRQKYGAKWASPMKDMVLNNVIELTVELTGTVQ
ncbi:MAG: YceI family protein [Flavobacteriales bacterium]|nr:YceI family protein [Flavobacteriales bacterium]